MIKVMIVDDSITTREFLKHIINDQKDLVVAGEAKNGKEAVDLLQVLKPDIITMDIEMPEMNGYETTMKIMQVHPLPIIVLSSAIDQKEIKTTFKAIEAGALCALEKPCGPNRPEFKLQVERILRNIRVLSSLKLEKKTIHANNPEKTEYSLPEKNYAKSPIDVKTEIIAIGASTGGPPALKTIFDSLPEDFSIPMVVVQHITPGFMNGMVDWFNTQCRLNVKIAEKNEFITRGNIYLAPDDFHMEINQIKQVTLKDGPKRDGSKPSVSELFQSVGKNFKDKSMGILLTGMGRDGADGLSFMKSMGAVTIAQDKKSSVVYGMPGEAVKQNAVDHLLSPEDIAKFLISIDKKYKKSGD